VRRLATLVVVILCVAMVPLASLAANPFNDLTGGVHDPDIDAIYNAGITTGCVPNESYCPTDLVTRQEMASFLARTAGIGSNKPVTNAARLALRSANVGGTTYAANDLVAAARNSNDSAEASVVTLGAQSAIPTPVAVTPINAPGPGYILVNASGLFRFNGCPNCIMSTTLAGSPLATVNASEAQLVTVSRTWLVRVNQAGTVNLPLIVLVTRPGQVAPIPSGTMQNTQITAMYVPFGTLNNEAPGEITSEIVVP
jgi:hypothetical protein